MASDEQEAAFTNLIAGLLLREAVQARLALQEALDELEPKADPEADRKAAAREAIRKQIDELQSQLSELSA